MHRAICMRYKIRLLLGSIGICFIPIFEQVLDGSRRPKQNAQKWNKMHKTGGQLN